MSLQLSFQKRPDLARGRSSVRQLRNRPRPERSRAAIKHAIFYTFLFVPVSMIVGLFLAAALNQKIRFISFYRLAGFIPVAVSTIATGHHVPVGLRQDFGLANSALGKVGIAPPVRRVPVAGAVRDRGHDGVGLAGVRQIIYLAALQGVPPKLIEAAAIDGASGFTVPHRHGAAAGPATLLLVVWPRSARCSCSTRCT